MEDATYLIADACWCERPLEFVVGACSKCGRWLDVSVEPFEDETTYNPYVALDLAIQETTLRLLDEAEADGVDTENDKEAYAAWLEARLAALDAERVAV